MGALRRFGVGVLLSLAACGGGSGGGSGAIASQPLGGLVNGKPWTVVSGETNAFLSDDKEFFTTLYDKPTDSPCSGRSPTDSTTEVILNIPNAVGKHPLGFQLTATIAYDDGTGTYENKVALQGLVEVTSITATKIVGAARVTFDAANSVEGQFEVDVCPP